jgi:hypothetical protein
MLEIFHLAYLVNRALFNICMPYTSQDEIATAVKSTVQKCVDGELQPEYVHPFPTKVRDSWSLLEILLQRILRHPC